MLLKDAERVRRVVMIAMLLTAGVSKVFSGGGFYEYYSALFQSELRINLPAWFANAYLLLIPFIEIAIALALLVHRFKWWAIHAWFAFMLSLTIGHYVLEEFSAVNQMLDYFFIALACLLLPTHRSWFARDTVDNAT